MAEVGLWNLWRHQQHVGLTLIASNWVQEVVITLWEGNSGHHINEIPGTLGADASPSKKKGETNPGISLSFIKVFSNSKTAEAVKLHTWRDGSHSCCWNRESHFTTQINGGIEPEDSNPLLFSLRSNFFVPESEKSPSKWEIYAVNTNDARQSSIRNYT